MIVSDSTAIITLSNIDEFTLLKSFTRQVLLAPEVYEEVVVDKKAYDFLKQQIETGFVKVDSYHDPLLFQKLNILLDTGESASIVLAKEKGAMLLIDEKKGRRVAKDLGVEIVGLIGMIRFLYVQGKMDKAQTEVLLRKLDASSFRISRELMELVLKEG
ncbi:hypothetical protein [Nitratifractor sp.]